MKKSWKEFMKGFLKVSKTFQGTFNLDNVVQMIILVYLLKKGNRELIAKVNLGQSILSHVLESYTSQLYQNAQVNQNMNSFLVWRKK